MPQEQRTTAGEQRWHEVRTRAQAKAKKFFDRIQEFVQRTGTIVLDEGELVKTLTGFALDERKREEHAKHQAATDGQPEVNPEDQHFAELVSAEMRRVPDGLRGNDLWLRFVAKGIARARKHWEDNRLKHPPDPVAQEFKAQEAKPGTLEHSQESDYQCFAKARAKGEPTFTLRAQDVSAPGLIFEWVRRNMATCTPEKIADALQIYHAMLKWPADKKKAAD